MFKDGEDAAIHAAVLGEGGGGGGSEPVGPPPRRGAARAREKMSVRLPPPDSNGFTPVCVRVHAPRVGAPLVATLTRWRCARERAQYLDVMTVASSQVRAPRTVC